MVVTVPAKFLGAEERTFTNDHGQQVDFFRVQLLDYPELNPITLSCSRECYGNGLPFDKLEDVNVVLTIQQRGQGGIRVQVQQISAA